MSYKRFPSASNNGNRPRPTISSPGDSAGLANSLRIAEEFLRTNIGNPVAVADIAAATGLKVRALQRVFRNTYGDTPMQFLLNLRIQAAREIILRGDASSVRDVAAQLLFSNPSRFSKLYRKIHRCIPSQDIRQHQQNVAAIQSGPNQ